MGDTEWFDVAYQVYLAAIFGGGTLIWLSGFVGDAPLGPADVRRVLDEGAGYLGVLVAVAIAVGLRSGAEGGPLTVEVADARHLLLAPVSRRSVLRQPLLQRARAVAGAGALIGGMAGLLAAQRMPGTAAAWTMYAAAFGAVAGLITVVVAVHAHAVRLPGWAASVVGGAICGWQAWTAVGGHPGPLDTLGDLGLWGSRQHTGDLIAVAVVILVSIAALATVAQLRVEHLDRRGDLVSQLRFAVTTQDLRTVVLLRRQLRQEQARSRPLVPLPAVGSGAGAAVARRSLQSMLRMPLTRVARVTALGGAAGVAAGMAARGTTPAVLVCGLLLFVAGLDLIEPLSQEIDHPDRTDDLPVEPGWLHLRLLVGPSLFAVVPALAGAAACAIVAPSSAIAAVSLALPITWAGMTGSVVNAVRDGSGGGGNDTVFVPPEMAGMKTVIVLVLPLVVSTLGTASILAMRARPDAGTDLRLLVALVVYLGAFGWWLSRRSALGETWTTMQQGATT